MGNEVITVPDGRKFIVTNSEDVLKINPETGDYHLETVSIVPNEVIKALPNVALAVPYPYDDENEDDLLHPEFKGMTCAEVIYRRNVIAGAKGDLKSAEFIIDRAVGKPKQSAEIKTISANYFDLLDSIGEEEAKKQFEFME